MENERIIKMDKELVSIYKDLLVGIPLEGGGKEYYSERQLFYAINLYLERKGKHPYLKGKG